ncbi:MAG: putative exported protein [Firmicutes bacterium]|nr:putative exported protein [Bacillota bacterium]
MSKSVKKVILLLTCFMSVLVFATTAAAISFSADIVSSDDGKTISKQKMYMTTNKIRMETKEMANIVRMDKKLVWMVMFEDKMYMEQPFNTANTKSNRQNMDAEPPADDVEKNFILRETINGYAADKYRVTTKDKNSHYIWISSDPGITMQVKTAAIDGSWWQEFRNIRLGEPDPALFEVPVGFEKMLMPAMFGHGY